MTLLIPAAWLALGMTVPLSGTVVDAAGQPVAGATVWLGDPIATQQGPEVLATTETDDQGRFRLERADDLAARGDMWSPTLWAYKPGSHVAFLEIQGELAGGRRAGPPCARTAGLDLAPRPPARWQARQGGARPVRPGDPQGPAAAGQAARPPRRDDRRRRPGDARRLRTRGHLRVRRDRRGAARPVPADRP